MTPFLTVLLAMASEPYRVPSKPELELYRLGIAPMRGGDGRDELSKEAIELREKAAAKFKEAKEYSDTLKGRKDDNDADIDASEEELAKFDGMMADARQFDVDFRAKAKEEGNAVDLREGMDFYYGKATGGEKLPWHEVHAQQLPTPGQQFAASDEYKELVESGRLTAEKAQYGQLSKPVDLSKAATDLIQSETGGPGAALVTPQYLPGILPLPQRPLTIRELFSQAPATSDSISYARQNAFDDAAAAVAQAETVAGGGKPQSSIAWTRETGVIETIATWMAATRQQLADAGQVASLIDNQGRLMLQLEEEDQILNGNGTSPNISGLLDQTLQTLTVAAGGDNLDAVRTCKRLVKTGTARANADTILLNPYDSEQYDLLKDSNGLYRGGNPIGNFNFNAPIWSLNRVESEAITLGTAIVGAFKYGATVYERQGITVYTTDSHSDFFIRNIIAILFEERLGFACFFPTAFVEMTLDLTDWGT